MNHAIADLKSTGQLLRQYMQVSNALERTVAKYDRLCDYLSDQVLQLSYDQSKSTAERDRAYDRYMRLAQRRTQETLRNQAQSQSYLDSTPSCSCGLLRGEYCLSQECKMCRTEVRYTQQQTQAREGGMEAWEAYRRNLVHELYVTLNCQHRLRENSPLNYVPVTRSVPQMPQLRGVGRLWSAPLPAWVAMAQADTRAREIFKAPLDPKFQQVLDDVQQLIQPR